MAELDDKLLKNLDKTLASMNQRLQGLEQTLAGVKEGMVSAFNPAIIKSFSDEIRGLKAARIIDADKSVAEVNKVYSAIQELSYMVKTGMKLEPVSLEQLDQYKKRLEEIDKLLEPLAGKRGLKTDEYLQRSSLYRERDRLRDILDSENPVVPVPLKKEEIAAAVEMLKRYEEVYKNIRKGDQQRAVEIANIAAKERAADMQTAETAVSQREQAERRKAEIARAWAEQEAKEKAQREKMKTAAEKAAADERTAIAEAEAKKKSEIAKAWAEQDRRRYEKDGDPLGEIAARKGLTGTLAALEDQTAVNEWRKQTAEEQKRIAKEEAEVEKQIKKEIAEEEKKLAAEKKQRYQDAVAANKAMTKAEDDLAEAKRRARTAESKAAYTEDTKRRIEEERKASRERAQSVKEAAAIQKKADAESMANQRRQIQIKSQLAAIDKNRITITKQSSDREKALAAQQQADYRSLQSELSKLIARQKELNAVSQGSGRRAKDRLSTYTISESEKAMRRYADAVRNAHREQKKLGDETNKMLPTLQRLASAFGVAFSVRGLAQFGKKLIETRGEFEMQFVAMKQIIGDVDAATKIWNQTMQQALQSPFKAMQLVTYTKQLAAYRIETEKLFDTTKRLADISAGLGVDMGRLILAFGQVKSANFLRASEVRQFTEAGVNIVGNLAQYFTELEGRAVSTADVMERITKRMVMFSDVEEIFRRMTDEGGEFYKMQEIQADTVKGQINKLHDAYDQMLNTIGQANQGTLRDMIDQLNKMVRNWREVALFLKENGIALAVIIPLYKSYKKGVELAAAETTYFTTTTTGASVGLRKLAVSERLATIATNTFRGAMFFAKTALKTFVPLLVIEGIVLLINKMTEAGREAKRLSQSLDEVGSKNAQSLQSNIDGFNELVEKLKQATEGSQEYYDIRNKIQSKYGEYLDSINAETISVENLANAYDRVIERMREKSRQHIMEEGLEEISKDYGKYFEEFVSDISKFEFSTGLRISRDEAQNIAKIARDLYEKNEKYRGLENTTPLFKAAFEQYGYDTKDLNFVQLQWKDFYKAIERSYEKQIELETKANSLTKATSDTHQEYLDQLALEEEHEKNIAKLRDDASIKSSGRLQLAIQAEQLRYEERKLELQAQYQKKSDEWLKNEKDKLKENYGAFLNAYNEQVKAYIGGRFGEGWMQGDNSDAWKAYNFMIANQDRLSQGQTKWEEKILNDKKLTEENIQRIKEQQATQTAADSEAAKALNESLKQEEDRLELIKKQMELLGLHEKQKGGSGSANNSIYGERIRLLQDMLQKYKQLAKEAYGYAKAEGKVSESFEDAWNSIMPAGYGDLEVPTSYKALAEMLQRLEAFTPAFDKNGQLSKMLADLKKAVSDALSQVDIELSVRIREDFGKQMEKAFGDYELTIELQKLNLPKDAAKDLLDFDYTSLGELQTKLTNWRNERLIGEDFDEEDMKLYENWMKKVTDKVYNMRKEKAKQYTKYLEQELSERAKLEMQYTSDVAFVTANIKNSEQKDAILENLKKNYTDSLNELQWKSFKESDFYVEMMQDLTSMPSEYLDMMMTKLDEWVKKADVLSPKALKEVLNARRKIVEAQVAMSPIRALGSSLGSIRSMQKTGITGVDGEHIDLSSGIRESKRQLDEVILAREKAIEKTKQEIDEQEALLGKLSAQEEIQQTINELVGVGFSGVNAQSSAEYIESVIQNQRALLSNLSEDGDLKQNKGESEEDFLKRKRQYEEEVSAITNVINMLVLLKSQREQADAAGVDMSQPVSTSRTGTLREVTRLKKKYDELNKAQAGDKDRAKAYEEWNKAVHGLAKNIADITGKVKNVGNAFYDMLDAVGVETDEVSDIWKDFGNTVFDSITSILGIIPALITGLEATGVAVNASMGVFGLIVEVIQLLIALVTALAKANDASVDKKIEESKEKVDALQKAYDRLEKSIEKTFDTVSYMRTYNEEVQNLYEQIEKANEQINAAQDYKDDDKRKEVIEAAEEAKQEALDTLEEIKQARIEVFGGIGRDSYRSAAEGFVDAWKSAFLETGDGLQGLQDHFDEFLNEWFVKQATMRIAGKTLEPLFRDIDAAVDKYGDGGTDVMMSELKKVFDRADLVLPDLSDKLAELAGQFNLGGEGSLSGLAAGIQGMTEEQANILEAYWNSVRGYTANIDMNVSRIAQILGAGGDNSNPMLAQMTLVAQNTNNIRTLLESVRFNGGEGVGIRVYSY